MAAERVVCGKSNILVAGVAVTHILANCAQHPICELDEGSQESGSRRTQQCIYPSNYRRRNHRMEKIERKSADWIGLHRSKTMFDQLLLRLDQPQPARGQRCRSHHRLRGSSPLCRISYPAATKFGTLTNRFETASQSSKTFPARHEPPGWLVQSDPVDQLGSKREGNGGIGGGSQSVLVGFT